MILTDQEPMSQKITNDIQLVPNQGWDQRVHVCRCGPVVDAFVVVSARYVVLVDTLISPQTATAMLAIAREHLADGRQLLVVNNTGRNKSHLNAVNRPWCAKY